MRKIFHLELKADNSHRYYGSLSALFSDDLKLSVSKGKIDRWVFDKPFENEICIIRKSVLKTKSQL